jgi:hypothetical protein
VFRSGASRGIAADNGLRRASSRYITRQRLRDEAEFEIRLSQVKEEALV